MAGNAKSAINQAAAQMGKKGGRAGKGSTKVRGNSSYYRDMQRKSVASRIKKQDTPLVDPWKKD